MRERIAVSFLLALLLLAAPAGLRGALVEAKPGLSTKTDEELARLLEKAAREREAAPPAKGIDYSGIDRTIGKEPAYTAQPLYCLFLLDREGKFRVWAVFDKSSPGAKHYDVLYLDRNGNGDLTEEGERLAGSRPSSGVLRQVGNGMSIRVPGSLPVPGASPMEHGGMEFHTASPDSADLRFSGTIIWNQKKRPHQVNFRFGPCHGKTPEEAPVIHPDPEGFLAFGLGGSVSPLPVLSREKGTEMDFMIVNPGLAGAAGKNPRPFPGGLLGQPVLRPLRGNGSHRGHRHCQGRERPGDEENQPGQIQVLRLRLPGPGPGPRKRRPRQGDPPP